MADELTGYNDCVFNAVSGNYYHHNDNESGLNNLSNVISHGAFHDSSERSPAPRCDPDTRKDVLKLIMDWIDDPSPSCSVLWLYGPVGVGKTAILQSIAERLRKSPASKSTGKSAGSFFFSRGKSGREEGDRLFSTIAYQLAMNVPGLRVHINNIMVSSPILHTKSMNIQLQSLIVDAFRRQGTEQLHLHTPIVIIDGLDECRGNETQKSILALISQAIINDKIPLRFLIASRPEAHIRESFDQADLSTITRRIVLDDSFNPQKDIELVFRKGFAKIYAQNHRLVSPLPDTWPGNDTIDILVRRSSGQFIYANIVLNFVGADSESPANQLNTVFGLNISQPDEVFSDLDRLYTEILSACRNPQAVVQVLGAILALHCPQPPEVIEDILSMEQGEVTRVLGSLHSLMRFPGMNGENYEKDGLACVDSDGFWLLHRSFQEYLADEQRSGQFFVDVDEARTQLSINGFKLITRWTLPDCPQESVTPLSQRPHSKTWGYLKWHLATHFYVCPESARTVIIEDLTVIQQRFSVIAQNKANFADSMVFRVDALYCAMTVLVHMMFGKFGFDASDHRSNANQDLTLNEILDQGPQSSKIAEFATNYYQYRSILDECYTSFTTYSGANIRTLTDLINSVPGFLVQMTTLPIEAIVDLYPVNDLELVKALLEQNKEFVNTYQFQPEHDPSLSGIRLNRHVSEFLLDKSRSGPHHIRPSSQHAAICSHALSIFYDLNWSRLSNLDDNAKTYLSRNFENHLYCFDICTDELVNEHPTSRFLDQLDNIVYYGPDMRDAPIANLRFIWHATSCILPWVQRQQQLFASDCDLQERLCRIANRIYGQILYVELRSLGSADEDKVGVITLCPPLLAQARAIVENVKNAQSEPTAFQHFGVDTVAPGRLQISDDFLLLPEIIPSLTDYLTDAKRAGQLYVSPDEYHTQLAEHCLEISEGPMDCWGPICIVRRQTAREYWKHSLVRALPSERIFAKLRVLKLIGSPIESLRDIIKWLEGLPEPPLDVYIRWQMEILREEETEANQPPCRDFVRQLPPKQEPSDRKIDYATWLVEQIKHGLLVFVGLFLRFT